MDTEVKKYSIGSLFAGIGGFELGLERAIPGAYTLWQVEENTFCQKVLAKHWPEARIYEDVRNITKNNIEQVDILCGGFPCQDISPAGKREGINGEKSGLWWEMHRIISELQPKAVIMENVAAINIRGLGAVLGSLSQIGYDAEWSTIRASHFGAPHKRERWFCIAYPSSMPYKGWTSTYSNEERERASNQVQTRRETSSVYDTEGPPTYPHSKRSEEQPWNSIPMGEKRFSQCRSSEDGRVYSRNYWEKFPTQSPLRRRDDGLSYRLDRIASLGNAIVPQCSEWIGRKLWESGILQAQDKNL